MSVSPSHLHQFFQHVTASIIASSASYGSTSVQNFAVQRVSVLPIRDSLWDRSPSNALFKLFYDTKVRATTAVLATFSTAVFGYGIVGLLRPLTVYPSEMVYWMVCPIPSHVNRVKLNQRSESAYRFYFPRYTSPLTGMWKRLTFGHQAFTLTPL